MFDKILKLGKETAVYGLSTVLGRLLNFLLVPFYTNFLLPAEYGIIANVYAYIAFAFVLYCFGLEQAYMRFHSSLEIGDQKQNFSTPFFSLAGTSLVISLILHFSASTVSSWIGLPGPETHLVQYAAWILFFDTLTVVPFAAFRMEQKAKVFASLRLASIILTIVLNMVLIVEVGMKSDGVLLANLIASGVTFLIAAILNRRLFALRFSSPLYKDLLRFGLPYIPAGLAGIAMQVVDRPIVKALTDDATLGIYQANYRLGIFMMLIVGMFDYAWRPFFLNHAKDADAKQLFSKVFTIATIGFMAVFLVVSFFIEDVVRIQIAGRYFIHPGYWSGLAIVPWILAAYIFTGFYVLFVVGIYLQKKTQYLPLISGAGAVINIVLNVVLIPTYGILGAAQATLWAYVVMAAGMYMVSQKFYRIEYEWGKVVRIAFVTAVVFGAYLLLNLGALNVIGIIAKAVLVLLFFFLLLVFRVVEKKELQQVKTALMGMI